MSTNPTRKVDRAKRGRGRPPKDAAVILTKKQKIYINAQLELKGLKKGSPTLQQLAKRFNVSTHTLRSINIIGGPDVATQPETLFKKKVQKDLDKIKGVWHFKCDQRSLRGIPDMILCVNGFFIALELKKDAKQSKSKSPRNKLQKWVLESIREKGYGIAEIVYPENWDEMKKKISQLAKGEIYDSHYLRRNTK